MWQNKRNITESHENIRTIKQKRQTFAWKRINLQQKYPRYPQPWWCLSDVFSLALVYSVYRSRFVALMLRSGLRVRLHPACYNSGRVSGGGMSRWGEGTVVVFSRMLLQAHTARSRGMLGISINPRIKRDERVALCCRPHSLATHRHPRPPPARAYSPLPLTCAPYMLVRLLLEVNDIGVWFLRGWKNTIFHCISSMRIPYLKYLV